MFTAKLKYWYEHHSFLSLQWEFIQFCKTLYSFFHGDPEENDLFQAIATVTSLVLQIGEAGHRGHRSGSEATSQEEVEGTQPTKVTAKFDASREDGSSMEGTEWTVSYAQILASLLTEQSLVNFFEKPADLSAKISEAKQKQYHQRAGLLTLQQGTSWLKCEQWDLSHTLKPNFLWRKPHYHYHWTECDEMKQLQIQKLKSLKRISNLLLHLWYDCRNCNHTGKTRFPDLLWPATHNTSVFSETFWAKKPVFKPNQISAATLVTNPQRVLLLLPSFVTLRLSAVEMFYGRIMSQFTEEECLVKCL